MLIPKPLTNTVSGRTRLAKNEMSAKLGLPAECPIDRGVNRHLVTSTFR